MKKQFLCLLLVIAVCFSFVACAEAEDGAGNETGNLPAVYVESEFAPLKKVIVSQSEFTDSILPVSRCYVPLENVIAAGGEIRDGYIYNTVDQWTLDRMTEERDALCAVLDAFVGGVGYAVAKWASGILFDLAHCGGNFVIALVLFVPLRKLFSKLNR